MILSTGLEFTDLGSDGFDAGARVTGWDSTAFLNAGREINLGSP
jgi:hypothetical protein